MAGLRWSLEIGSVTEEEHVALLSRFDQVEISFMDEDILCHD